MRNYVFGIDVGGTNIKMGIVDSQGRIVYRSTLDTRSFSRNKQMLIDALADKITLSIEQRGLTHRDFLGLGIGFPGLIDPIRGRVIKLTNIPGWSNVDIKKILEKKLRIPAFIENDVNLITLGEWKFGAGRGCQNLVCITLGTGVGGGLILNNQLYRGEGFVAGEIGHIPLNEDGPTCNCGGFACFERYVGNRTLEQKIFRIFKKVLTIQEVRRLAEQGNKKALAFWKETGAHIGNALVGVVNLLNPRVIIIGGGVSHNYRFLFPSISKVLQRRAMKVQAKMVKLVRVKLGDDAGIIGARVLVQDSLKRAKV